jgi:hypothetical protein
LVLKVLVLVKKVLVLIAFFSTKCCIPIITQTVRIPWVDHYLWFSRWICESLFSFSTHFIICSPNIFRQKE